MEGVCICARPWDLQQEDAGSWVLMTRMPTGMQNNNNNSNNISAGVQKHC